MIAPGWAWLPGYLNPYLLGDLYNLNISLAAGGATVSRQPISGHPDSQRDSHWSVVNSMHRPANEVALFSLATVYCCLYR